jgi:hypothetical protein
VQDDRPPPDRDGGFLASWSTDDADRPTDEMLIGDIVEFRLPLLLLPPDLPGGETTKVSLEIHNVGFDVIVATSARPGEAGSWLRVVSSNQIDSVDCGPAAEPIPVRGSDGCFGVEQPGQLLLSWDEEWIHQARWTQDPAAPLDANLDFYLTWLSQWRALRR